MSTPQPLFDSIPVLDASQIIDPVPDRVAVALEAKILEKTMVTELVATWLEALRPEMERMAHQIVQSSAQAYWRNRHASGGPQS